MEYLKTLSLAGEEACPEEQNRTRYSVFERIVDGTSILAVPEDDILRAVGINETTLRRYRSGMPSTGMTHPEIEARVFKTNKTWYWTVAGLLLVAGWMRVHKNKDALRKIASSMESARKQPAPNLAEQVAAATGADPQDVQEAIDAANRSFGPEPVAQVGYKTFQEAFGIKTIVHANKTQLIEHPSCYMRVSDLARLMIPGSSPAEANDKLAKFIDENRAMLPPLNSILAVAPADSLGSEESEPVITPVGALLVIGMAANSLNQGLPDDELADLLMALQGAALVTAGFLARLSTAYPSDFLFSKDKPAAPAPEPAPEQTMIEATLEAFDRKQIVKDMVAYFKRRSSVAKELNNVISDAVGDTVVEAKKMLRSGIEGAASYATHERVNHAIKHHVGAGPRTCWDEPEEYRKGLECVRQIRADLGIRRDHPISQQVEASIHRSLIAEKDLLLLLEA